MDDDDDDGVCSCVSSLCNKSFGSFASFTFSLKISITIILPTNSLCFGNFANTSKHKTSNGVRPQIYLHR